MRPLVAIKCEGHANEKSIHFTIASPGVAIVRSVSLRRISTRHRDGNLNFRFGHLDLILDEIVNRDFALQLLK